MVTAQSSDTIYLYNDGDVLAGWEFFEGSYHKHFPKGMTYEEAEAVCHRQSSNLVYIDSVVEQKRLEDMARNSHGIVIGLKFEFSKGFWKWTDDNSQLTTSYWWQYAPYHAVQVQCAAIQDFADYKWVDIGCKTTPNYKFACERK